MPQKLENLPPISDDVGDECQHIPLNCPWTIISDHETLTVVIRCLKWTFNYDFWIRVSAHPERNPNISKQKDTNQHHPLLVSPAEALNDYEGFPEPHLNSYQLHIRGELLDYLFWRFKPHKGQYSYCLSWFWHQQIFWHRSRSGRGIVCPANRTRNQLCSRRRTWRCWWNEKLHFQEGSTVFFFTLRTSRVMRITLPQLQPGRMSEQASLSDFQMDETNLDTEWKWNIVLEEMEKMFETFCIASRGLWIKGAQQKRIAPAVHGAERTAQARQRRQWYID